MPPTMTRHPVPMTDAAFAALLRARGVVDDRAEPVVLPDRGDASMWCVLWFDGCGVVSHGCLRVRRAFDARSDDQQPGGTEGDGVAHSGCCS
jgi:hypothetical protein